MAGFEPWTWYVVRGTWYVEPETDVRHGSAHRATKYKDYAL